MISDMSNSFLLLRVLKIKSLALEKMNKIAHWVSTLACPIDDAMNEKEN